MRILHYGARLASALLSFIAWGMLIPAAAATYATGVQLAQGSTQVIIVPSAPPPPQAETPPPAPDQTMIWETGHWTWNGHDWVWVHGQYLVRPNPAASWVSGHWVEQPGGGWTWIEGHWQ